MHEINRQLSEYNGIIKETDKIYRDTIKALGLTDSTFWILYTLYETDCEITQRDIVNANYFPPQTINSALKKLEIMGYAELHSDCDKRKKLVKLTEKGRALAMHTVGRVMAIETKTMESLTPQEQDAFLGVFRKYTDRLKNAFGTLSKENSGF